MNEVKTGVKKTNTNTSKSKAISKSTEKSIAETVQKKEVKKRNRPDLQNFGQEYIQPGDNARYLRHALASFNLPPIDIADPKLVEDRIKWYLEHCGTNDMKPTVNGLANALGVSRDILHKWKRGETRGTTHLGLIKRTYDLLEELWENYMQNGKINPVSGIFLGKNHFGYQDKSEVVVTPNNKLGDAESVEDVRGKYLADVVDIEGEE